MTFIDYLKRKQRVLIIWFLVHSLALFVNIYRIEGKIIESHDDGNVKEISLFMDKFEIENSIGYPVKNPKEHFWPFVNFYRTLTVYDYNPITKERHEEKRFWFYGIFHLYDSSEFIAYSALIFIVLYFIWSSKMKSKIAGIKNELRD